MKTFHVRPRPSDRLMVFARVPEPGRVKTRLAMKLGDEKTFLIYEAMLADLLDSIGPSTPDREVEILWTGSGNVGGEALRKYFPGCSLSMQAGESLGDRLSIAFSERIYFHQASKVIAIGTDDPELTRGMIDNAFDLLDSCDWVLGPATDGGYYLIGCRGASFDPAVFQGIEWGTAGVFAATEERIRRDRECLAILPVRSDIDQLGDLDEFCLQRPERAVRMRALLRDWGWPA